MEPWEDEPDQGAWRDSGTGLFCLARRGPLGNWCGYVVLPDGHPWNGLDDDQVPADIHGGITFSEPTDGGWMVGFDCAHLGDLVPGIQALLPDRNPGFPGETYKPLSFVMEECSRLAAQVASAQNLRP